MPLALGIDVGTAAATAVVCDDSHNIVSTGTCEYELLQLPAGGLEQDAEDLWNGATEATRRALAAVSTRDVRAISLSTQGGTLIPTDAHGRPVTNAISWLDQRAIQQAANMSRKLGHEFFYHRTGFRLFGSLPFLQLLRLKKVEPATYAKAAKFLTVADFLNFRLTGRPLIDPSNAAVSTLFDIVRRDWSKELLAVAGITEDRLADVVDSGVPIGKLTRNAASELGLSSDVVVVSGGLDQYCAALGAGAFNPGDCLLSSGAAWALLFTSERLIFDLNKHLFPGPHVLPGRFGVMTSIPAAGVVLDWFKENFGTPDDDFFTLSDQEAASVPPGSHKLLFFPHFIGAPTLAARGAVVGLTLAHDAPSIYRSILEGIAYEAAWRISQLAAVGLRASRLKMIGGGARSRLWQRILCDVSDLPLSAPSHVEAPALGAALLAAIGVGIFSSPEEAYSGFASREKLITPDEEAHGAYAPLFSLYRKAFDEMQGPLKSLAALKL